MIPLRPSEASDSIQRCRLPSGGAIDRGRPMAFTLDGRRYEGFAGDTLASALLANDVRLVGRSFKYHRPRGVLTAGSEEPNALFQVGERELGTPNTPATMLPLVEGLTATTQHCWPSASFDLMRINELAAPLIPAGFYYKTFMWPPRFWRVYEHFIRRAAGLGRASAPADRQRYEHFHAHCDLLVIGAGAAGLAAALAAGRAGVRVILVDEHPAPGGRLRFDKAEIAGAPAIDWVAGTIGELESMPHVTRLSRATAFARFDHGLVSVLQHRDDGSGNAIPTAASQRLWEIRAKHTLLASGAIEQPLIFPNNDRPGVMMAGAVRAYINAFAVAPGKRAVIFTIGDDAYRTALDLHAAGVAVAAVIDARPVVTGELPAAVGRLGIEVRTACAVIDTSGDRRLTSVRVCRIDGGRDAQRIDCDLLCVGGGWSPALHLSSHLGAKPRFDEALQVYLPADGDKSLTVIGAVSGRYRLQDCLRDGVAAGVDVARTLGLGRDKTMPVPQCSDWGQAGDGSARLFGWRGKRFVDLQGDVTVEDIELSAREGMTAVEHLKRYTTLGMWTDQGKTSNLGGMAVLAAATGGLSGAAGTTTFRPPYTPVAIGAFAGRMVGRHFRPIRRGAAHCLHAAAGAIFVEAGLWLRPRAYPAGNETLLDAARREVNAVRGAVGVVDVSTLGKIDLQGPDAIELIERVYANGMRTLPVGRARYGLMLREDGIAFDDGTVARLDESHFLMTTTTANAGSVLSNLEHLLQTQWRDLRVDVSSVTEQWSVYAIAGPQSRAMLAAASDDIDFGNEVFPFMGVRMGHLAGLPVRVCRISYSGEMAYEVHVPADQGATLWTLLLEIGRTRGVSAYGTEAMGIMRIEKGHIAAAELDGRTTAIDLGLGKLVSTRKDFIGRRMAGRPGLVDPERPSLVGVIPADRTTPLRAGAQLSAEPRHSEASKRLGFISSTATSPTLGHPIGLGFLSGGLARLGDTVYAHFPLAGQTVPVTVTSPVFFDPEGQRVRN